MYIFKMSLDIKSYEKKVYSEGFRETYLKTEQLYHWMKKENTNTKLRNTLVELIDFELKETMQLDVFYKPTIEKSGFHHSKLNEVNIAYSHFPYDVEEMKKFNKLILDWWSQKGFGFVSEIKNYPEGICEVQMIFNFHWIRLFINELIKKEKIYDFDVLITELEQKGFQFYKTNNEIDYIKLIDNPSNRTRIHEFLVTKYPSVIINNWETEFINIDCEKNKYIKSINISIPYLDKFNTI